MFGRPEMGTGAVMGQRPRQSLFEDDADNDPLSRYQLPELNPTFGETKYSQINKNLQGIISFCASKLGGTQSPNEARDAFQRHLEAGRKHLEAQSRLFEEDFPDSIVEGDAGRATAQLPHQPIPEQPSQKIRYRSPDNYVKYHQTVPQNGFLKDKKSGELLDLGNFLLSGRGRGQTASPVMPAASVGPSSFTRRLQAVEDDARKMAVRKWIRPPEAETERGIAGALMNKLRNFTSSPFMPLKCPKCQLEISKRELETMRRSLFRAQGFHDCELDCCGCDCGHCEGHMCGGDEEMTGLAEWECTCGQSPEVRERGRGLHRDRGRDLALNTTATATTISAGLASRFNDCLQPLNFNSMGLQCSGGNNCCHSDIHNYPPNYVRHEDTHGKCRDCYRQDMLHDAIKLKNSIDAQYERQRTMSTNRNTRQNGGGTTWWAETGSGGGRWAETGSAGGSGGRWVPKGDVDNTTIRRKVTDLQKGGRTARGSSRSRDASRSGDEGGNDGRESGKEDGCEKESVSEKESESDRGSRKGRENARESNSGQGSKYPDKTRSSDRAILLNLDRSCYSEESVRSHGADTAYSEEQIGPYASTSAPSIDE